LGPHRWSRASTLPLPLFAPPSSVRARREQGQPRLQPNARSLPCRSALPARHVQAELHRHSALPLPRSRMLHRLAPPAARRTSTGIACSKLQTSKRRFRRGASIVPRDNLHVIHLSIIQAPHSEPSIHTRAIDRPTPPVASNWIPWPAAAPDLLFYFVGFDITASLAAHRPSIDDLPSK